MAGCAGIGGVNLAVTDKRRVCGGVAAYAISRCGGCGNVLFDLGVVIVGVTVEICDMALNAGSTIAAVDCGIAITVNTNSASSVRWVMAGGAVGMDCGDGIAGVAVDAEGSGGDSCRVTMAMAVEVGSMTTCAGCATGDGGDFGPVGRIF